MRIGVMLRSIDEKGGIGLYSRNIIRELLNLDQENEYIMFYRSSSNLGYFAGFENVVEHLVQAPNKAIWDQFKIPLACRKENVDVLFHPKFTIPVFAPCKTVMVLHGAGWFMPEYQSFWSRTDISYARASMPLYCKRASAVISVSHQTTETFNRVFQLPTGKITTVYLAPARNFRRFTEPGILEQVRRKYHLPDCFILVLSGYDRGDRKNFTGILRAYQKHYGKTPHSLVVGGKDCIKFKEVHKIPENGYGKDIVFPGWIEQADLPAVYSMADVFLHPSNVEAFPMPVAEALACGTPTITSNANGLKEIAGDAALYVSPVDHGEIALALGRLLSKPDIQKDLSEKGIRRAQTFSWDRCARETLNILTSVI